MTYVAHVSPDGVNPLMVGMVVVVHLITEKKNTKPTNCSNATTITNLFCLKGLKDHNCCRSVLLLVQHPDCGENKRASPKQRKKKHAKIR